MSPDTAIQLGRFALALGRVNRATDHPDGRTPESDTDHTVMLSYIVATLCSYLDGYDAGLAVQFALVHDTPEVYAGDTNSFAMTPEQRAAKEARECEALQRIVDEFGHSSWLVKMLLRYEAQEEPEARLVRYIDKAMPKIAHCLNGCASVRRMGADEEELMERQSKQLQALNEEYSDLPEAVGSLLAGLMDAAEEAWKP